MSLVSPASAGGFPVPAGKPTRTQAERQIAFPALLGTNEKKRLVGVWEDVKQSMRRFVEGTMRSLNFICDEHPQRLG